MFCIWECDHRRVAFHSPHTVSVVNFCSFLFRFVLGVFYLSPRTHVCEKLIWSHFEQFHAKVSFQSSYNFFAQDVSWGKICQDLELSVNLDTQNSSLPLHLKCKAAGDARKFSLVDRRRLRAELCSCIIFHFKTHSNLRKACAACLLQPQFECAFSLSTLKYLFIQARPSERACVPVLCTGSWLRQ